MEESHVYWTKLIFQKKIFLSFRLYINVTKQYNIHIRIHRLFTLESFHAKPYNCLYFNNKKINLTVICNTMSNLSILTKKIMCKLGTIRESCDSSIIPADSCLNKNVFENKK